MSLEIKELEKEDIGQFKNDIQHAFQKGATDFYGKIDVEILPESHIDQSLNDERSHAYKAVLDGELVGGAIVLIDENTQHNHLDFLYVNSNAQGKGIGQAIWKQLEKLHPETRIWETHTPYFDKRNIHFYVNQCGFHIVEYYNKYHPDETNLNKEEEFPDIEYFEDFFRFQKKME